MKWLLTGLLALATQCFVPAVGAQSPQSEPLQAATDKENDKPLSDAQVKAILIAESIASYAGSCPCPYSTARNGSHCGRRSAYSREGGAAPLCYPKDVSSDMVKEYRDTH